MLFHSNYHTTPRIDFNHRAIYNDNLAIRAPSQATESLPATDRVIRIKFTTRFRLTLPLLNPKTLHALILSQYLGALCLVVRGRHFGGVIPWGRHDRLPKQWNPAKNGSITTYEGWRQNLRYSLSFIG